MNELKNLDEMSKDELISELVSNGVFAKEQSDAFEKLSKDNLEILVSFCRKKNEEAESSKQEVTALNLTIDNLKDEVEKAKTSKSEPVEAKADKVKEKEVDVVYEERRNRQALIAFAKEVGEKAKQLAQLAENSVKVKV